MASKRKRPIKEKANSEHPSGKKARIDPSTLHEIPAAEKEKLFSDKSHFTQELSREDHERERLLYKLLASEDIEDRIRAADVIISALLDNGGVPAPVLERHLERRLFRGLASGSDAARVGYSYATAEILGQLYGEKSPITYHSHSLRFDAVLRTLIENTRPFGNISGPEERDHYWGQLFGLKSFFQSGILFNDRAKLQTVLQLLVDLGNRKVWLRSQAAFVVAQAIPMMKTEDVEMTLSEVTKAGFAKSAEGLGVWLVAAERHPQLKLPKPWKHPLSSGSMQDVAAVLKNSSVKDANDDINEGSSNHLKQSNTTMQLHFVWDLILGYFIKSKSAREADFKNFWDQAVDQGFFHKAASDHQKLTGFKVFEKVLKEWADQDVILSSIFSKSFMACVMNQAYSARPRLHRAAVHVLSIIEKAVEAKPELLAPVLTQLLGENGAYDFDKRVKGTGDGTTLVEKILRSTNPSNAHEVIAILRTFARQANDSENDQKSLRIFAEYLFRLVSRAGSTVETEDSGENLISVGGLAFQELAALAYAQPGGSYPVPLEKTRDMSRKHLISAAASLLKRPDDFLCVCNTILAIDPSAIVMADSIKTVVLAALLRLRKLVKTKDKGWDRQARQGLAVLHAVSVLQLYTDPNPDVLEVLQDTQKCYDRLHHASSGRESGIAEILVELLLSMLATSSQLTRQTSLRVFEAFTPYISPPALEYLTEILAAEENSDGYKALFSTAEEDEDEDFDDVEEIDQLDEQDEIEDGVDSEDDDSTSSSGSDSESSDESEDSDEDDTKQTRPKDLESVLMKTYKVTHTLDKDYEAESSDDDADMSDSEMLVLDEQLSGHMKLLQSNGKKQRKDALKKVIEFKHRVLDLLDVYIKKEIVRFNPMVFGLLPPLLQLARASKDNALSHKAVRMVTETQRDMKKSRVSSKTIAIDVDVAISTLEKIQEAADDPSGNKAFAAAVSSASLTIATVLFTASKENYSRVADVYRKTQDRWVLEDFKIRVSLFTDWYNWCQSMKTNVNANGA